jgi:hypothetical protein
MANLQDNLGTSLKMNDLNEEPICEEAMVEPGQKPRAFLKRKT